MFKLISNYIDSIVKKILIANILTMLILTMISITMRWFGISLNWIEPLVRHMVFATAFLGAVLATASGKHIGIEILPKFLEVSGRKEYHFWLQKITSLATIVALAWLTISGYEFLLVEKEFGKEAFAGIHSSFLVGIIPIGFGLLFVRTICSFFDFSRDANDS